MKRRLWPVLLFSGIGLAILLNLGVWQVRRLAWKEALIARMEASLNAGPVSLALATAAGSDPDQAVVRVSGSFTGMPLRRMTALNGGPGWEIVQSFTTFEGAPLLVARGTAAENQSAAASPSPAEIVGILRRHASRRGFFDPDNDAAGNRWYWWDVPAMSLASGGAAARHADLVLHLLPGSPGTEGLFVGQPRASLRNNHLGYAITWFGLAVVLLVMTAVFLRQRNKT